MPGTSTIIIFVAAVALPAWSAGGVSCDSLKSLTLPDTTITLAEMVAPGEFTMPGPSRNPAAPGPNYKALPAFCRVASEQKALLEESVAAWWLHRLR